MFLQTELAKVFAANKARALLSVLSIALGAASLIAMVSLTEGYSKQLETLNFGEAANRIAVSENFYIDDHFPPPTIDDWKEITRLHGDKIAASFIRTSSSYHIRNGLNQHYGALYGVMGDYTFDSNLLFYRGRNFNAEEQATTERICVLGYDVARKMFGSNSMIGKSLRLNNSSCRIIGVLNHAVGRTSYFNESIFMPFWAYLRVTTQQQAFAKSVDVMEFFVADEVFRSQMVSKIDETMRKRHGAPAAGAPPFLVGDPVGSTEAVHEQRRVASIFVISLGGLSLVTGVIGVANAMLASVTERKREIGIRLAIGASPQDIRIQFLFEAIAIACVGVWLGLVVGLGSAALIGTLFEWPFALNWQVIALGICAGMIAGVGAGLYPASKAARCPPAEVIRMTS